MDDAVVVAGGTGGHINSAIVLGEKFEEFNFNIEYISGRKHLDFQLFDHKNCRHVFSYALLGKGPFFILKSFLLNFLTFLILLSRFLMKRPKFIFGVGGYVCGPALLAAYLIGIPVFILEQNSVMGLTNRLLSKISRIIFINFHSVKGLGNRKKVRNYGNPLRREFFLSKFQQRSDRFHLLIFGGSLGSREINNLLVDLLRNYRLEIEISVLHQTGKNKVDVDTVPGKIDYEQREYLDNIVQEYQKSDLIICRGGASTISELRVVKRPVLIIPIRFHKDQHQAHNAYALKEEANFPVHVNSVEGLAADQCKKLQSLIEGEYKRSNEGIDGGGHVEGEDRCQWQDSSTLIVKAVLENV